MEENIKTKDLVKAFFEPLLQMAFVKNSKDEEKKDEVKNEDVDKRKLIDEVAGMMKTAGCDDEVIRTAIGKMEKIGYDKSEAGTADNKKVKNEDAEDKKEKEDIKNKKVKNEEDEEDKGKVEDLEKDVKEDIKNKCKNSVENGKVDYFAKLNEIYNSTAEYKPQTEYVSRADREKAAEEYFKN